MSVRACTRLFHTEAVKLSPIATSSNWQKIFTYLDKVPHELNISQRAFLKQTNPIFNNRNIKAFSGTSHYAFFAFGKKSQTLIDPNFPAQLKKFAEENNVKPRIVDADEHIADFGLDWCQIFGEAPGSSKMDVYIDRSESGLRNYAFQRPNGNVKLIRLTPELTEDDFQISMNELRQRLKVIYNFVTTLAPSPYGIHSPKTLRDALTLAEGAGVLDYTKEINPGELRHLFEIFQQSVGGKIWHLE